jgi:hypothetical protein
LEKLKLIFGKNFEIKNIYINNKAPEIIWNKSEIPKLVKEIMLLKEEKNKIEQDLNSLKLNFDSVLKEKGKNNQVTILFQIKEENKNLRKAIQQIKQKNKIIQEKLKDFNRYNFDNEIFLYEDVNKNLFLELTPMADDIWLNAMARLKGTPVVQSNWEFIPLPIFSRSSSLSSVNKGENMNDIQLKSLRDYLRSNYRDIYSLKEKQ